MLKGKLQLRKEHLIILLVLLCCSPLQAQEQRAKRPFKVTNVPEANLQVYIPARPMWNWETQRRNNTHSLILSTPALYYPPASIEFVSVPDIKIPKDALAQIAASSLETVRARASIQNPQLIREMQQVQYGDIVGYEEVLTLDADGKAFEALSFTGMLPSGRPITFFTVTSKGQLNHIRPMLYKIVSNLKYLPN